MKKEIKLIPGTSVKWKGNFDFKELYATLRKWFNVEGYGDPLESLYVERKNSQGKSIEIKWSASKVEEDYFGLVINLSFHCINLNDVEVVNAQGEKMKLQNGEVKVSIRGTFVLDYKERFHKEKETLKQKIYEKHFIGDNIEKQKIGFFEKVMDLIDKAKGFLNLYRF